MADSPLAIVQRMYELFGAGDMDAIRNEVFSPDLVWHFPGRHPLAGDKYGPDEVIAFFQELNKLSVKIDLTRMDNFGDDTVVEVHRGYTDNEPSPLDVVNCTHYRIQDGKIVEVQVYVKDQYAADNYFWSKFKLKPLPDRLAN
jgi:ketosteroid isomerase-like protein